MPEKTVAPASGLTGRVPAWTLAVVAMLSVQLGAAWSVGLFPLIGPLGSSWLRLCAGAVILLAVIRPRPRDFPRGVRLPIVLLGVVTAIMNIAFLAAIDRLPLGTVVAIEFLGPLTVAAVRVHALRMLAWPAMALVGVLLLTRPWDGQVDAVGVALAAVAAAGWGAYILLTQRVGDQMVGVKALALTVPIAAIVATPFGMGEASGSLTLSVVAAIVGLALLMPVLPFTLEMLALRRLTTTAFGTLMALEPGIAALIGVLVLHQIPSPVQVAGVALVVAAGIGAERRGRRPAG